MKTDPFSAFYISMFVFSCYNLSAQVDDWYIKGLQTKDPVEKVYYFTESIELKPTGDAYWNRFKAKFAVNPGEEAYEDMVEAIKLDKKYLLYTHAIILKDSGFYEKALKEFEISRKSGLCFIIYAYLKPL